MLSVVGDVFFGVASTYRQKGEWIPTIYLDIRDSRTGKMLGQMRFNCDPSYSTTKIRMAFNIMDLQKINPATQEGAKLLEEVLIGGFVWLSMDNHNLVPKGVLPYMVIHDYVENSESLNIINAKIRSLLSEYGCDKDGKDMFIFNPSNGGNIMLSEFLKKKQQV